MRQLQMLRSPMGLLLMAAALGLLAANLWFGRYLVAIFNLAIPVCFPVACFGITLPGVGLLVGSSAFFYLVGLELKRELVTGHLRPLRNAVSPLLAAIIGVALPAAWYLMLNQGQSSAAGWPIPTATDVTFALAVFVAFGKWLPGQARTFLLTFAVIDDVIAVVILTVAFPAARLGFPFGFLPVVISSVVFLVLQRARASGLAGVLLKLLAILALYVALQFMALAGIEPALLALVLALCTPLDRISATEASLAPWVNYLLLPVFAFFATFVPLYLGLDMAWPVFVGIVARPIFKFIGVFAGGWLGARIVPGAFRLPVDSLWRVAVLGGVGFTVSLLAAQLAFGRGQQFNQSTAVVATLVATVVSMIAGAFALRKRADKAG